MLIATMIKQAKDNNLSSKLHVLELLITLLYMENEKGGEKKWLCLCDTIGNQKLKLK